jgi:glutathione S-transferase
MTTGMTRLRAPDATAAYKSYLRRIANMLDRQDYLLGSAPCVADFAVYHPLWFSRKRVPVMADILNATPGVLAWMDRMAALGHGTVEKFSAAEAIALAAQSTPLPVSAEPFQDEHGIALGSFVTVAAESFGAELTSGELMAATRMHYTLRRTDERAGTVHVHFPRVGFVLKAVNP